ncbi:MAG: bifunctional aspartate kinase/homoserine dehydrogenase I [Bacteroidales bacterium]|nr:bifunctional aspartate kinase/homoserine dehydrogenase I [Bacteroidales bacterium]
MQILKFGGKSVGDAENINKVVSIINRAVKKDRTIVVASAISDTTDKLIDIGDAAANGKDSYLYLIEELQKRHNEIIRILIPKDSRSKIQQTCDKLFISLKDITSGVYLLGELTPRALDKIVSHGELLSTNIISETLISRGINNKWVDSRDLIKTENVNGQNTVISEKTKENINKMVDFVKAKLIIAPGFISSNREDRTTTLGRGGSDYTAALFAEGCQARVLEIWTDVTGMMTADPRVVKEARTINNISYKEALELSHFGAKVVYPPTIQPVVSSGIPIYVKNTFEPDAAGTLIEANPPEVQNNIKGISSSDSIALLSMEGSGMVGVPGYSSRLFDALSKKGINIILITQASSVHTMCVAIDENVADIAKEAVDETFAYEISLKRVNPLKVEKGFSIISLVGANMRNQTGASGRMFEALGRNNINIRAIAQGSSERNVSAVVNTDNIKKALQSIHSEFFNIEKISTVYVFLCGYGNVGKALVKQIGNQCCYIKSKMNINIILAGISNSHKYIFDKNGFIPKNVSALLSEGLNTSDDCYFDAVCGANIKNSVFVDCTSSQNITAKYTRLIENGISIVTSNKIAGSSPIEEYLNIKTHCLNFGTSFKYETTVGAALPIISVIRQIKNSGDNIHNIEAILSGTLNYIFSVYDTTEPFAEVVKNAQKAGYTEPDPRTDLSGKDVFRKLVILAREADIMINMEDIDIQSILPYKINTECNLEEFYNSLRQNEKTFCSLYKNARESGFSLRVIASIDMSSTEAKGKISLMKVNSTHPFYNLYGNDNALSIISDFYKSPLVIKGAGAGAEQTASGILNDIISIIK